MVHAPESTLLQYRLVEKIGAGGMGEVWRAHDVTLDREVALKFLPAGAARDATLVERFLAEARALAALNHPDIVTVYEFREHEGRPLIAMEYVRGRTLKELLPSDGLEPARLIEIGRRLAGALAAAHARGVIHGDLKPANVMIGDDGRVRVLDFGLARFRRTPRAASADADRTLTLAGDPHITGTPAYMAPEQLQGCPADERSDLFALGVVLYEMAAGRRPFDGDSAAALVAAVLRDRPEPLAGLCPGLPAGVARLVEQCLEKDPAARPASAAEMQARLQVEQVSAVGGDTGRAPSIAVMPFADMSPAGDQGHFCDGIAEEIINLLSRLRGLRVAARTSSFAYRASGLDSRAIAHRLGVGALLEGSVRRAGDHLRVTVDLVGAADGLEVWAAKYDRQLADVFAIQDEIAGNVVRALEVTLAPHERSGPARPPTSDLQAYDFYLRGRQFYVQFKRRAVDFARQMFERAIRLDPAYARAHAGLADCASFEFQHVERRDDVRLLAEEASARALALDPELPEAHAARGVALSLSRRYAEAAAEFDAAARLAPRSFDVWYFYGRTCFAAGELERAAAMWEKAAEMRPEDHQALLLVAQVYDALGRAADARAARERGLAKAEARLELNPDDVRALYMGANALAALGDGARGLAWADRALAMDPDDSMVLYNVACIRALAGRVDEALDCAERAVATGLRHKDWFLHDSNLDGIRQHPRFQALMTRL